MGENSTRLLLLIPRILRTVWLNKCLTRFKEAEGMAKWGLDYNSTSRLLWEMSTKIKGELIIPKFIWHHTNIWVSSGTKQKPGELRCQGTRALRFPGNPAPSTDKLYCRIDRQSRGGQPGLPHLKTQ